MRLSFLRHNRPATPYGDYARLSYSALRALGLGEVSPAADPTPEKSAFSAGLARQTPDVTFHSPQRRTADSLVLLGLPVGRLLPELDEIPFDLADFLSEAEFAAAGLPLVRERLLGAWARDARFLAAMESRIGRLEKALRDPCVGHVLCATHGFLMRFLWLRFVAGKSIRDLTERDLAGAPNFGYLDGFSA